MATTANLEADAKNEVKIGSERQLFSADSTKQGCLEFFVGSSHAV